MKAIDVDKIDWRDGCFLDSSGKPIPILHKIATIEMLRDWQDSCENELKLQGAREFAEKLKAKYPLYFNEFGMNVNDTLHKNIDEVINEMKSEVSK